MENNSSSYAGIGVVGVLEIIFYCSKTRRSN